ncbi:ATP-binding protein [Corynebacterium phocae]|uniref:ATP-binding protein n=1 Tax=Corynebacterium phocae TaxID=161895 RepID=A0A1L7D502_9CORY|nr:DUF3107 domain-containing protein [Corynebacterium phocae]APT93073.1 ATP-binding protein [Corynebacterium phocae]KAA8722375.1 DUF3107 domain-containing protein [Corynebacterium phocae]
MDIRIGFADTARELVVRSNGTQEELTAKINEALGGNAVVELADDKGKKYIIRTDRIVYVEIGPSKPHAVGFAGV